MNIKIHTSLVLAACTLTGLLLGGVLFDRYRQFDVAKMESGTFQVTMRNVELLQEGVGQWMVVNDAALLKGQSLMLNWSDRQANHLIGLIEDIAANSLADGEYGQFAWMQRQIAEVTEAVFASGVHTGEDRMDRLAEIAVSLQPRVQALVGRVTKMRKLLHTRDEHRRNDLDSEQQKLIMLALLLAFIYFGVVWLCWLWTVHRVVVPIESLSAAASVADHGDREFVLPLAGPVEVRQLTTNISNFVGKLQAAKAGTEEEVRERTAELVLASKAKGQFLATMSHELRTPLNGIINMNELILDTELDPEQSGFARTAKSAAEALLALINDILDFSKIEARKLDLETVELDIRGVVDGAVEILNGVAESKGLELTAVTVANVPQQLFGDPTRLRQVLINLLNNALKFTVAGGVSVHVSMEPADPSADAGGAVSVLRLEVRDTGIGIPGDRRAALFQAFEQVDSSTTRKYGGTGLGLAICRELVQLMGGEIGVDSVEGQGSTFWFTVCLGAAAALEQAPAIELAQSRILLLSCREMICKRVREQLLHVGVPADCIAVAESHSDLEFAAGDLFVLYDPYGRESGAFEPLQQLLANPRFHGVRVSVFDHWMRHWPASMGPAPDGVGRLVEPTKLEPLRDALRGIESVAAASGSAAHDLMEPVATEPDAVEELAESAGHVLIVEDTIVNQRVVRAILKREGFSTTLAANGLEAVEACERENFDLILMDCQMPVMDGLEATRCIRSMELERTASSVRPSYVPIVALTANAQDGFPEECFAAGMNRFVSKPCRPGPLMDAIRECLQGGPGSRPAKPRVRRVLVADDDAINRKVAQSVLRRAGFETTLVENGQQAVDELCAGAFDIVLMDCQMPILDGLEASSRIRELETEDGLAKGNAERVPIVALTGNVQDSDRDAALAAGMDEVLTKPFRPKQLVEIVVRMTGQVHLA